MNYIDIDDLRRWLRANTLLQLLRSLEVIVALIIHIRLLLVGRVEDLLCWLGHDYLLNGRWLLDDDLGL